MVPAVDGVIVRAIGIKIVVPRCLQVNVVVPCQLARLLVAVARSHEVPVLLIVAVPRLFARPQRRGAHPSVVRADVLHRGPCGH
eukprot:4442873-Heterocapsa_arctica.AAC.1